MSFLSIFNWMVAHVPGFVRPAVNWLIEGLRSITNYIGARWNAVGRAVGGWLIMVVYWSIAMGSVLVRLSTFAVWLVRVRIPGAISAAMVAVMSAVNRGLQALRDFTSGLIAGVVSWARDVLDELTGLLSDLRTFVTQWIERLRGVLSALIGALSHVLQGPDVLAEWLASATWRALLRLVAGQRDRIALWLTRESVSFTQWLAKEVEDIILRWL